MLGVLLVVSLLGCSERPVVPQASQVKEVDFSVLLSRMTSLKTFAETPLGNSFLESSYDRTGGNQDWAVYTQAEPSGRVTLLRVEGAGYLSRIWTAGMDAERFLFFFDGESEPRIDLAFEALFGGAFPFVAPLAGRSGGGWYSLVPIPFKQGLRVEIVPKNLLATNRNYFQINYTKLDLPAEAVTSFSMELSAAESNLVVAVNATQEQCAAEHKEVVAQYKDAPVSLKQGGEVVIWEDDGEGLLTSFGVRILDPKDSVVMAQDLLRYLRIQMYWDGAKQPSVDVPLGDFFCNPFYLRSFASMPLARVDDTFVCRFPMPYQKGARCVLKNSSQVPVTVSVGAAGNRESAEGLSRKFHAVWRASDTSGRPLNMVESQSSGHYVGCFLNAIGQDGSWTILEGDEYLKPDPGVQPPQLGTGLEDYFSGAYYYTSLFDLPLHGLIEKGAMRTDQYRLHLLDAVGFDHAFEAGIEFGDRNHAKGYMSSVAYWYSDKVEAVPFDESLARLLSRPKDRFELPGLMSQFFMLERGGLYRDAASRMEFFAKRYEKEAWCDLLRCRALGYREKIEGFNAVKADYETLKDSSFKPAAEAAEKVLWLHEKPERALLGVHALGKYRLLLDGKEVASGEGRGELRVVPLQVAEGQHEWELDFVPTKRAGFLSFCLRTPFDDFTSAGDWETINLKPTPEMKVPEVFKGKTVLPNMSLWAFEPNAFVDMQSPASGITFWYFWDAKPRVQNARLKMRFEVKAAQTGEASSSEQERSADELRAHAIN